MPKFVDPRIEKRMKLVVAELFIFHMVWLTLLVDIGIHQILIVFTVLSYCL